MIGDGLVGQWAARTLATDGIETAVLGRRKNRLALLPPSVTPFEDPTAAADWFAGGDLVVQTAGRTTALAPFLPRIRHRGAIVSAAFDPEGAWLDVQTLRDRELSVAAVSGWSRERLIETRDEIAAGRLSTLDLITDEVTPEGAQEMYDRLLAGDRDVLGVAIRWG